MIKLGGKKQSKIIFADPGTLSVLCSSLISRLPPMALVFISCQTVEKCLVPQSQLWYCLEYHADGAELHVQVSTFFRQQL